MRGKNKAIEMLKDTEEIISNHVEAFTPSELMSLATALRYLMAYIENNGQ